MRKLSCGLYFACLAWSSATWAGELAVGVAGAVHSGAIRGMDEQAAAVPFVYYQGDQLSVLFTSVNWRLINREPFQLSLTAMGRFDGYKSKDSVFLAGMQTRDAALDAGLEAAFGNLSLAVVSDVSNTHKGTEATLNYVHGIETGALRVQLIPGVRWQSSKLAGYYFGVRDSEATMLQIDKNPWRREAYQPGSALIPTISALASYRFSPRWSVIGGAQLSYLPTEISDSPLVARRTQWGLVSGIAYHFD